MNDRRRNGLILTTLILCGGLVFFYGGSPRFAVCPFRAVTGIPCPGCGGVRSTLALLNGDIGAAFGYNLLSPFVALSLAVSVIWLTVDIIRNKRTLLDLLHRKWNPAAAAAVIGIIALNWFWNIYRCFA